MFPQNNSFFLWLALRNRVIVDASLQVRNIQLVSRCSLCEKEGKSVLHIGACSKARPIWESARRMVWNSELSR